MKSSGANRVNLLRYPNAYVNPHSKMHLTFFCFGILGFRKVKTTVRRTIVRKVEQCLKTKKIMSEIDL